MTFLFLFNFKTLSFVVLRLLEKLSRTFLPDLKKEILAIKRDTESLY